MKLGVCYYPEHWPTSRWAQDARMMREAGLSLVRISEFAWQRIEPEEGEFTWEWLDLAIETLAAEGLKVILGTPTPTPPAWLCAAQPQILPVDANGHRRRFGSRRHYCSNQPVYHQHTRRIVQAMAERYGSHPAITGWQTDNEFGCHDTTRCYCETCAQTFRAWLLKRYGTLEALNEAWGAVFWSQSYSDWDQIQPPNLTVTEANPAHVLDYYRFSSDSVVAYQQIQVDILRQHVSPGQFVTHNLMGNFPDLDYHDLARPLDFVTWDSYPTGYAEVAGPALYLPGEQRPTFAFDCGDPYVTGFCHDITRGVKQAPFWVMEQQCGNINWAAYNTGVRPGTARLWTWHALGSGADAVLYFRWRACLFAQEQHHSGLLHHDASPNAGYQDVQDMLPERALMDELTHAPVPAKVALVHNYDDLWAIQLQPHNKDFAYQRHLFVYYRALQQLGIPVDIVSEEANLAGYDLVIAPTLFLSTPQSAEKLSGYVKAGGSLLLGVRSGFKTQSNLVTSQPLPGFYRELAGATTADWHSLPPGAGYAMQSGLPGWHEAHTWAEALRPDEGTRVRAAYTTTPFAGLAALTEHSFGKGTVFTCGIHPNFAQAFSLLQQITSELGIARLATLPQGMLACARGKNTILLNFTDAPLTAEVQGTLHNVPARDVSIIRA